MYRDHTLVKSIEGRVENPSFSKRNLQYAIVQNYCIGSSRGGTQQSDLTGPSCDFDAPASWRAPALE